ncbi:hypothetical protein PBRA_001691 [Plasmodiophora brassicae]|uniref:RNA polymerase II-associated protein 3 n=1 Tax=Plasmodiophora brassicae TaxID=37360 RepID=A0A0G4IZI4_PLABS|nr:hypothetical protein PBRA_001691 [Plasmodiophora brassicae]
MEGIKDIQRQIRHNADELNQFVQDVYAWEDDCNAGRIAPPGRESKAAVAQRTSADSHTYDKGYVKWEKFDVDKALREVDENETPRAEDQRQRGESLREKGNEMFRAGRYAEAIQLYSQCLDVNPSDAKALSNRAAAAFKLKRFTDAENDCSAALAVDPDNAKALMRRGMSRASLKKIRSALIDFEHVLRITKDTDASRKEAEQHIATLRNRVADQQSRSSAPPAAQMPRRRLVIEEVSESSDDGSDAQPVAASLPSSASPVEVCEKVASPAPIDDVPPAVPDVPRGPYEFERSYRSLQNHPDLLFDFMRKIPVGNYARLLGTCIDAGLIGRCVQVARGHDHEGILHVLKGLTSVPRFSILAMFLDDDERHAAGDLLGALAEDDGRSSELSSIGQAFSLPGY